MTPDNQIKTPSEQLRMEFFGCRLGFTWLGVRKTLTDDQKQEAADAFNAEGKFLSAAKKLIDTKHPAYRDVTGIRSQARSFWKGNTLPYPEDGVRLIKHDRIDAFDNQMREFKIELESAVDALDERYAGLKAAAKENLGSLWCESDYPANLHGCFAIDWDFPSLSPPDYLLHLSPELYEVERVKVAKRFDQAITMAEDAFAAELHGLITHLADKLKGGEDGKPKVFRDSAVENIRAFFQRVKSFGIKSNDKLDELMEDANKLVAGVDPAAFRKHADLGKVVGVKMTEIANTLESMMTARPRRLVKKATPQETSDG